MSTGSGLHWLGSKICDGRCVPPFLADLGFRQSSENRARWRWEIMLMTVDEQNQEIEGKHNHKAGKGSLSGELRTVEAELHIEVAVPSNYCVCLK